MQLKSLDPVRKEMAMVALAQVLESGEAGGEDALVR